MEMKMRTVWTAALLLLLSGSLAAQQIVQARGADSRVNYESLLEYGPWDDRNYALTQADLALLSDSELDYRLQIPVFFRVELRKRYPDLPRTGPSQYPRSSFQKFRINYGGYLVNGNIYTKVVRDGDLLKVKLEGGVEEKAFVDEQQQFLNGEIRLTSPNGASESSIEISPVDENIVVAGVNGPFGGQDMFFSTDGGESWQASAALPLGGTCCDPTIDYSSDGEFVYTATLPGGFGSDGFFFYRSSDGGQTWDDFSSITPGDPRREIGTGFTDKEFIHVDKHAASPFQDNVYATWHLGNVMQFARSTDFGNTWSVQALSSGNSESGIGSDIVTDKGGNIYYFWPAFNSQTIKLRKSTNGGSSFQPTRNVAQTEGSFIFPVPSMDTREVFIYVSADADLSDGPFGDSIYAAWTDSTDETTGNANNNHARIQVAYSRDGGDSWSTSTPHEIADADDVDRWHQWLSVGPDGTVHIVYYDTRRDPSRQSVDLFYSFSVDGAVTWSTPERVTTEISPEIEDGFEFGDYNGLDSVLNNIIAIYTDNRNEGGGGADSVDVYAVGVPVGGGGSDLTLTNPTPGQAGVDNTFSTTGGTANGNTFYIFATAAGSSPMPLCPGTVPVDNPQLLGTATANGSGDSSLTVNIPAGASGRTGFFVAVDAGSCDVSNLVTFSFP